MDPYRANPSGREAFADVLLHIREQALALEDEERRRRAKEAGEPMPPPVKRNWAEFCAKARRDAGIILKPGNLKKLTNVDNPEFSNMPNSGLSWAIEHWNVGDGSREAIFTFPNGEVVTGKKLNDVLLGRRLATGELVGQSRNP